MRVCGVIAEYDPFHQGHARHLSLARQESQADYILCVMSGSFTQRGAPALLPAHTRAEMALRCGADIVLQLPYDFSVREAEFFALGGVSILHALGCVTHLSFGCEFPDLAPLQRAAALLESPDECWQAALRRGLDQGLSHAAAAGQALEQYLALPPQALNAPNTALALSYLRALLRLKSPIHPVPILRDTAYHAGELERYPSATAMRGAILRGDWTALEKGIPAQSFPTLQNAILQGMICPPDGLDAILRQTILFSSPEDLSHLPGVSEGLEMRMLKAAETAVSREELIAKTKTRRYTQGRISRALCHAMLHIQKRDLSSLPSHARILGFRKSAQPLLKKMQKSGFPLISRPAKNALMRLDIQADELWRIGAGLPLGDTYQHAPVILP